MKNLIFPFEFNNTGYELELVHVSGTIVHDPFIFGSQGEEQEITIPDFYIAKFECTQALWDFIMKEDSCRFLYKGDEQPAEHVSWDDCQFFIEKISEKFKVSFRLPTETEWEYAARGGRDWRDGYHFAGSNNMDESGWFEGNAGPYTDLQQIRQLKNRDKLTIAHPVGQKKPNQLGLYDMNGNLWEWCQDWFVRATDQIPKNGNAYEISTGSKVLRGGCHHNGAVHCTNTMRYEIPPDSFDGCIGFRLACDRLTDQA